MEVQHYSKFQKTSWFPGSNQTAISSKPEKSNKLAIYVQLPNKDFVKIMTKPSENIRDIKKRLRNDHKICTGDCCLIFQTQCLENDKTVAGCGLSHCSVIEIFESKQIEIVTSDGKLMTLKVQAHENVLSLKRKIHVESSIPVHRQCLLFEGKQLDNDQEFCMDELPNETQLHLVLTIQIFIKSLSGKTRVLDVEPFHTVDNLKYLIESEEAVPCKWMNLTYAGKYLEPHRTLSDYNIQNESTIYMNVRFSCPDNFDFGNLSIINYDDCDSSDQSLDFDCSLHNSTMISH